MELGVETSVMLVGQCSATLFSTSTSNPKSLTIAQPNYFCKNDMDPHIHHAETGEEVIRIRCEHMPPHDGTTANHKNKCPWRAGATHLMKGDHGFPHEVGSPGTL